MNRRPPACSRPSRRISHQRNSAGGLWTGAGLTSSTARGRLDAITGLAAIVNHDPGGTVIRDKFAGQDVYGNSVLVKYTYNGDSDLNGVIDADDYFRMDVAYRLQADGQHSGWRNGDVNYLGGISADDFYLIDRAFVRQAGPLAMPAVPAPALRAADVLREDSAIFDL